jgi:hypothetical protein
MMRQSQESVSRVLTALKDPKYKWRSADDIAKETGIGRNTVEGIIAQKREQEQVIQAHSRIKGTRRGRIYYTTRRRFIEEASPIEKILGAIKNRIR